MDGRASQDFLALERAEPDGDEAQLAGLGYQASFNRSMSPWQNFALGFTYLSPVVGVYSVFAVAIQAGGPAMIWSYLIAGIGQFFVALVFGEIVSQYPVAGGLYPWARRLVGKRWSWIAGWIYAWALFSTIAAVATGVGPFIGLFLGIQPSSGVIALIGLGLIGVTTLLNLHGTRLLAQVAMFGFVCEIVGALVVGLWLLLFHRAQPVRVITDSFHLGGSSYIIPFLAASIGGLFSCYGFEACGDVAEETPDPSRNVPRTMRMTIYVGMGASIFVCLALLLSIPDMVAAIEGRDDDPIGSILQTAFGPVGMKFILLVIFISFLSCCLSLQAAVSRLMFAYGRDRMIVGGKWLGRVSPHAHIPVAALVVAGMIPAILIVMGLWAPDALSALVSAAVLSMYVAFQMVVLGALVARLRNWTPQGSFRLGRWGLSVNILALLYGTAGIFIMLWSPWAEGPWYVRHVAGLTIVAILLVGMAYLWIFQPYRDSAGPAGDAVPTERLQPAHAEMRR